MQDLEERPRRMDKLRRSLRSSLRRKKDHSRRQHEGSGGGGDNARGQNRQGERGGGGGGGSGGNKGGSGSSQWQMDEVSVRSGTCSFQVKVSHVISHVHKTHQPCEGFFIWDIL